MAVSHMHMRIHVTRPTDHVQFIRRKREYTWREFTVYAYGRVWVVNTSSRSDNALAVYTVVVLQNASMFDDFTRRTRYANAER